MYPFKKPLIILDCPNVWVKIENKEFSDWKIVISLKVTKKVLDIIKQLPFIEKQEFDGITHYWIIADDSRGNEAKIQISFYS